MPKRKLSKIFRPDKKKSMIVANNSKPLIVFYDEIKALIQLQRRYFHDHVFEIDMSLTEIQMEG